MKFKNNIEQLDTKEIVNSNLINWDFFRNKTVMITGATGLIGSQLVKAFLYANANKETNVNVVALVRNPQKVKDIFGNTKKDKIKFIYQDISKELKFNKKADFIIHTANSTSSASFVEEPVETIDSIVQGTLNVLDYARKVKSKSVVYLSSMEVYGEIPLTREEPLGENDLGYIDILKPRSSYQEGKRTAECLCSAYAHEYNVPVKIARLAQTFGAGVDYNDNRVFAQFARNIVEKQDIILKTKGETIRSYCYITDAVVAILLMLEKGDNGESYNVANSETTCSIKEMAEMLCNKYPSSNLAIQLEENKQYLGTLKYHLSSEKIQNKTGWVANVSLEKAYRRLVDSFYYQKNNINLSLYTKNEKKEKVGYSFLELLLSVTQTQTHKNITILGISIKFRYNVSSNKLNKNYQKCINRIRKKVKNNEKIRVLFLVRENSKWSYDELYKMMNKDFNFEPIVAVSLLTSVVEGIDKTRNDIEESAKFFEDAGCKVVKAFERKSNSFINLKEFSPDIVFYDQDWELPYIHLPQFVSAFALTFYSNYSFGLVDDLGYKKNFHRCLYRYFVEHPQNITRFENRQEGNSKNCLSFGYSKMDVYLQDKKIDPNDYWKEPEKIKMIYAPHHSFERQGLNFATFAENGKFILELAKKYPETTWVFKPHPRFKQALIVNNIMEKTEIEQYFKEWENIGKVYTQGNYFDIFRTSDGMISDCLSFKAEYLPTNKPLICPTNSKAFRYNEIGEKLSAVTYCTNSNKELEETFKSVIINKNDPQKVKREEILPEFLGSTTTSKKIMEFLKNELQIRG